MQTDYNEGCTHVHTEPHECPYNKEMGGDIFLCNCCEQCTQDCEDDI